jgi:hypothetical protein
MDDRWGRGIRPTHPHTITTTQGSIIVTTEHKKRAVAGAGVGESVVPHGRAAALTGSGAAGYELH